MQLQFNIKHLLTATAIMLALGSVAAPKSNVPITLIQPDGTSISCFVTGDEFYQIVHDENGYTIIRDSQTGYYVYAIEKDGDLAPTSIVVGKSKPTRHSVLKPHANISAANYAARRKAYDYPTPSDLKSLHLSNITNADGSKQMQGTMNNLVIFIKFADSNPATEPINYYDGKYNTTENGSVKDYYTKASYNKFTISTTFYPTPSGGNALWYTDTYNKSYYQVYNATSNPNGYDPNANYPSTSSQAYREHSLLKRAIENVKSQIPNDLNLDINNDGYVDAVSFIIEGTNDSWNNLLWPHMWSLYSQSVYIGNKRVWKYTFQMQYFNNNRIDLGTLCHELFHVVGAPDLYHYSYHNNPLQHIDAVGPWDIMCNTSNYPQSMGAYMKYKYGGWIDELPEISSTSTTTIYPLTTSATDNVFKIKSPNNTNEYFLAEFRKKVQYDVGLPNEGLLIYRINPTINGNAAGPPDEVYIYRPDGTTTTLGQLNQAPFSQQSGRTAINDYTNPRSFLCDGTNGGLNISGISAVDNTMTFTTTINSIPSSTISHASTISTGLGIEQGSINVTFAARFTADDLTELVGQKITSVSVYLLSKSGADVCSNEIIKIWKGGSATQGAGTLVYSNNIASTVEYDNWYSHQLTQPLEIEAGNEYWIGYSATATNGYPFGMDSGPCVEGKGAWQLIDNTWSEMTINKNLMVSATIQPTTYTITASTDSNGAIDPSGSVYVAKGASQKFTFTPNNNYELNVLTVDGTVTDSTTSYTFENVNSNHTINATFKLKTYTITASAGSNGSISPSGVVPANPGDIKYFTITASSGYRIESIIVDNVNVTASSTGNNTNCTGTFYKFENISSNHTISTTFAPLTSVPDIPNDNFEIYPNPASTHITVSAGNQPIQVSIYSASGVLVKQTTAEGETSVDISDLVAGVYVVKINSQFTKIIKQ